MMTRKLTRPGRGVFTAAALVLGWACGTASAGLPDLPPFVPPPPTVTPPPPVITPPPPVHGPPPPVAQAPEPGTLVLGMIGTGIAGLAVRRRKRPA